MTRTAIILFAVGIFVSCTKPEPESKSTSEPLFTQPSPSETGIQFVNTLEQTDELNIIQYLYFYNGGGVAVGDINNDDLPDLYFTANQGSDKLYLNKGDFSFEDISASSGIADNEEWSTGITMVDINGDGFMDIYVCQVSGYKNMLGKNRLYINQGDLTFKEEASKYGLDHQGLTTHASFFDYDRDGDLDVYLLSHSKHESGSFRDASSRNQSDPLAGDKLLRNEQGSFKDVTKAAGIYNSQLGYGLSVVTSDINNDGWPDIYVGNDFHENDYLYYNNGDGTFTDGLTRAVAHTSYFTMGADVADFNNDGLTDIVTLDMKPYREDVLKNSAGSDPYDIYEFKLSSGFSFQYPHNALQVNTGTGTDGIDNFSEIANLSGVAATDWSWSALFADLDNDGGKDLYITNGIAKRPNDLDYLKYVFQPGVVNEATDNDLISKMPAGKTTNFCYQNQFDLSFKDVSKEWGLNQYSFSNGAAYGDLDLDGDLDLVVNNLGDTAFVLQNRAEAITGNNYLNVKLVGDPNNWTGIGTKLTLYQEGKIQRLEQSLSRGFMSSVDPILHFGLGKTDAVDSLKIVWVDGKELVIVNPSVNQTLAVNYSDLQNVNVNTELSEEGTLFTDVTQEYRLDYRHREDAFYDLNREKLMPRMLSTQGPCLATADINGDGLEDFYVGGAKGQAGSVFVQTRSGKFTPKRVSVLSRDRGQEDVDAAFFDADGDGDQDLYVVSGGNEYAGENDLLKDRLYLNDSNGNFSKGTNNLPSIFENGACIAPRDFDGDGDLDLFLGTRVIAGQYGMSPTNYLLENNGDGVFTISDKLNLEGMVADAVWGDFNGDGKDDLAVAGEWMPITLMLQQENGFRNRVIPNTEGWWNTLSVSDYDGDGDLDLFGGNMGLNSNLQPTAGTPLGLYVKDFDSNGSSDPIMTYYRHGQEYPYNNLDEIAVQLVSLRKRYGSYIDYSKSTFNQIFNNDLLVGSVKKKASTFASILLTNGGSASFSKTELPDEAQFAPINKILLRDFNGDGITDVLTGGNFYECQPSIGRCDASFGLFLSGSGTKELQPTSAIQSGVRISGQVRDMVTIDIADGSKLVVVARNNMPLQLMKVTR